MAFGHYSINKDVVDENVDVDSAENSVVVTKPKKTHDVRHVFPLDLNFRRALPAYKTFNFPLPTSGIYLSDSEDTDED